MYPEQILAWELSILAEVTLVFPSPFRKISGKYLKIDQTINMMQQGKLWNKQNRTRLTNLTSAFWKYSSVKSNDFHCQLAHLVTITKI
jgi:hypothetical protein